jgi:predicted nucleotidyltransferase component of viral defense system
MSTYSELYRLQNRVLTEMGKLEVPFYLTGGTALSRCYLDHRWSDDLDFFSNSDLEFSEHVKRVFKNVLVKFRHDLSGQIISEDFCRTFIQDKEQTLKIEFVNDVSHYVGKFHLIEGIRIDNVENILCNKLTALVGRDEPKDVFDIIFIARNYSFTWKQVFSHAKEKALMNEIDIIERLASFPVEYLNEVKWRYDSISLSELKNWIDVITHDFALAASNSLGEDKIPIEDAIPFFDLD